MKNAFRLLVVFILLLASIQSASADEFFSSSESFAYFNIENKGLIEMDIETGEALLYDQYADITSIAVAPDGDLILNLRDRLVKTDLYKTEKTIFAVEDEDEAWIYHMKAFEGTLYVALTDEGIYSMQFDGTQCRLLTEEAYLHDFVVQSTSLYYCDGTALYRFDIEGEPGDPEMVVDEIVTAVETYDGTLYFVCGKERALRSYEEGGAPVRVIPEGIRDFALLSGGEQVAAIMRQDSSLKIFDLAPGDARAAIASACVDVAADENGLYYKQMTEGAGYYDVSEYSVFMVNDDYAPTRIGDE